ncbi:unnamed protein product [Lampetra fluviatilis]
MSRAGARRKNPPRGRFEGADGGEEAPATTPEPRAPVTVPAGDGAAHRQVGQGGDTFADPAADDATAPHLAGHATLAAGAAAAPPLAASLEVAAAAAPHLAAPAGLAAGAATGPYYTAATSAWPVEAATPPPFTASRECAVAAAVAPHLAAPVGWAAGAAVGPSYTAATSAWPVEAATPSLLAASREVSVAT